MLLTHNIQKPVLDRYLSLRFGNQLSNWMRRGIICSVLLLVAESAWAQSNVDLATDNTGLNWNNSGNWALTTNVSADGQDSLVRGEITHGQRSDIALTLVGPAKLRFKWRVSSEVDGETICRNGWGPL